MASLYYQRAGLPDTSHDGGCGLWIGTGYCHPGKHIPAYRRIPLTVAGSGALYEMELGRPHYQPGCAGEEQPADADHSPSHGISGLLLTVKPQDRVNKKRIQKKAAGMAYFLLLFEYKTGFIGRFHFYRIISALSARFFGTVMPRISALLLLITRSISFWYSMGISAAFALLERIFAAMAPACSPRR